MNDRDVVVTGLGLVTPLGSTAPETWQGLLDRRSGLQSWSEAVSDADGDWLSTLAAAPAKRAAQRTTASEPVVGLALAAAEEAWRAANLTVRQSADTGCVIGTSKGGLATAAEGVRSLRSPQSASCWSIADLLPSAAATAVAERFSLAGPALAPVAACATGLVACLRAVELIRSGQCDIVLAGAADASLLPSVAASFARLGVLSRNFPHAAAGCRPFHRDRDGFSIGEGAGVLVLEAAESARRRQAQPWAIWEGGVQAADPAGLTSIDESGTSLAWALGKLLDQAGWHPQDVDYLNYHGTGTIANDRAEVAAVRRIWNERTPPPGSSLKGGLGHLLGASGAVELALTVLSVRHSRLLPTLHLDAADPALPLDFVANGPRLQPVRRAIKISLGFGGVVATAAIRHPDAA